MGLISALLDGVFKDIYDVKISGDFRLVSLLTIIALVAYLIFFIVLLVRKSNTYIGKLDKALDNANSFLADADCVNEDNLEKFNTKVIEKFDDVVKNSWNDFILAQYDYPSKYITKAECIDAPTVKSRKRIPFAIFTVVIALVTTIIAMIVGAGEAANAGLVVYFVGIHLAFAFLFLFILNVVYDKTEIKVEEKFDKFLELLDIKVELQNDFTVAPIVVPDPVVIPVKPVVVPVVEDQPTKVIKKKVTKEVAPVIIEKQAAPAPAPAPVEEKKPEEDEYKTKKVVKKTKVEIILQKIDAVCSAPDASEETLQKIALVAKKARDTDKSLTEVEKEQLNDGLRKLVNAIKIKRI